MSTRLYLVPTITYTNPASIRPKYFYDPADRNNMLINPTGGTGFQYYGFHPYALAMAVGISDADHAILDAASDVYVYPDISPGPAEGYVRWDQVDVTEVHRLWINKTDRNSVNRTSALAAIQPSGDDDNPTLVTIASESNSDNVVYEVWGTVELGDYFEYVVWYSSHSGDLAADENVEINSLYPYQFDAKTDSLQSLDVSIPGNDPIDTFYEGINIPTDWLGPANTYREFLRQTMGMFMFHNRYEAIAARETGQNHSLFDNGQDLSTRYRDLTVQEQGWFDATLTSFGIDPGIVNPNNTFRQMLKAASDYFADHPFSLGGIYF